MNNLTIDFEKEYSERFAWRKEHYIGNIKDLTEITQSYGLNPLKFFPCLLTRNSCSPQDSLRYSILLLSYEATTCYVYGTFQSCILTCRALVERILKLEYFEVNSQLPKNSEWTLGKLIYKLDWTGTRISKDILDLAKKVKIPGDDRSHANLERSDPQSASMGGNRGITVLDESKHLIEPYLDDARIVIDCTFKILKQLYSNKSN